MKVMLLGGGVIGVTTAYYLLKDGHEVRLIERQAGVARECSHANGGFVAISQAVPWSALVHGRIHLIQMFPAAELARSRPLRIAGSAQWREG
jgi:glycine/D-amino acid oxidase-like deaminating enzyme